MDKQRARQLYELADRLSKLDVNTLSEQQRQQRSTMIAKLQEEVKTIKEFAPGSGDGGEEETLHKYARMWYNGDLATQQQVEQVLERMGWEIGEIESEEGGAFVVQSGDEHGDSYIGFNVADLTEGVAEGDVLPFKRPSIIQQIKKLVKTDKEKSPTKKQSPVYNPKEFRSDEPKEGVAEGAELKKAKRSMNQAAKDANTDQVGAGKKIDTMKNSLRQKDIKKQGVAEDTDGEYNDEAGMAKSSLQTMSRAVSGLMDTIKDGDNLPEWAQEKLSLAEDYLTTVWDYLLSQKEQGIEPKLEETKKTSPKLTPVAMKKTDPVSEEINNEAYERLQKVFDFSNYKG